MSRSSLRLEYLAREKALRDEYFALQDLYQRQQWENIELKWGLPWHLPDRFPKYEPVETIAKELHDAAAAYEEAVQLRKAVDAFAPGSPWHKTACKHFQMLQCMSDDDCSLSCDGEDSEDSFVVAEVLEQVIEDSELLYLCRDHDGDEEIIDRSDLMADDKHKKMVLAFERANPPPWDEVCMFCDADGCEECVCDECGRPCRMIMGRNYGCVMHPVV